MNIKKKLLMALMLVFSLSFIEVCFSEVDESQFYLLSRKEFEKAYYSSTPEELETLVESAQSYMNENYDVAFSYKTPRTKRKEYLLIGFDSGLVFGFDNRYFTTRFGTVLSGDFDSGWIVQYTDLDHTVSYIFSRSDNYLHIIDHTTQNEFSTDYKLSNLEKAVEAFYSK